MRKERCLTDSPFMWHCSCGGGIFCLITALCMCMSKNFDREKRKRLIQMQLACVVLLLSDAAAWEYRGGVGTAAFLLVRVSNFLVFLFSDVMFFLFHGYVCCCLFSGGRRPAGAQLRIRAASLLAMTGILLVIVSQFTGLYYYFDADNFYHRSSMCGISFLIPVVGMVIDLSLIVQYRRNISSQMLVSLVSYEVLPLLAAGVQLFYYGASLINLSISVSMILMFLVATVEQNQTLARREREAAEMRISLMMSQIAPHFIYNTLTSIREMCEVDPGLAEETVGEFAEYLRGNFQAIHLTEPIPFAQELHHVDCYLSIEKKRFGSRVKIVYDIQEENFLIPALTLQPVVENAVKHGLCKKKGGGTIWIRTMRRDRQICVLVEDDGKGFSPEELEKDGNCHIGIRNVEERIRDMCGGTFAIDSAPGKDTRVTMYFPQKEEQK